MAKQRHSNPFTISSVNNDAPFYFSASQLLDFYSCPARYSFSRRLAYRGVLSKQIQDGLDAHALMAGTPKSGSPSARAVRIVQRIRNFMEERYEVSRTEDRQDFSISGGFHLLRTIDAIATDNKGGVLLDYKIVGSQWDIIPEFDLAPRAAGFQAQCYLIPPPGEEWPGRIHFIVADDQYVKSYEYVRRPDDLENVLSAARLMREAWRSKNLPKNRGYQCHSYCHFRQVCYEEKDWEDQYEPVENDPGRPDLRYREE